jgi:hypothetical protein
MILRLGRVPRVRRSRYAFWLICLKGIVGHGEGYCSRD